MTTFLKHPEANCCHEFHDNIIIDCTFDIVTSIILAHIQYCLVGQEILL